MFTKKSFTPFQITRKKHFILSKSLKQPNTMWLPQSFRGRFGTGFTLVELLIVIIIVSILAAVSIPIVRVYIWKARFAEVFGVVGMVTNAKRAYHVEHRTYQGIPPYSENDCLAGNGISTGSTRVQRDLGIQVDGNCFFQYLIYPSSTWSTEYSIYFKEPNYDWAWKYVYASGGGGGNKGWVKYPYDGGPAQEYFTPP